MQPYSQLLYFHSLALMHATSAYQPMFGYTSFEQDFRSSTGEANIKSIIEVAWKWDCIYMVLHRAE